MGKEEIDKLQNHNEKAIDKYYTLRSEVEYLNCCSEIMELYNRSQGLRIHDSSDPMPFFRSLDDWDPRMEGMKVWRLHELYKALYAKAHNKKAFVEQFERVDYHVMNTDHGAFKLSELCHMR